MSETAGRFEAGGFTGERTCEWLVWPQTFVEKDDWSSDHALELTFSAIEMETGYDTILVYDGLLSDTGRLVRSFEGSDSASLPFTVRALSGMILVVYQSKDFYGAPAAFSAEYRTLDLRVPVLLTTRSPTRLPTELPQIPISMQQQQQQIGPCSGLVYVRAEASRLQAYPRTPLVKNDLLTYQCVGRLRGRRLRAQ